MYIGRGGGGGGEGVSEREREREREGLPTLCLAGTIKSYCWH